MALPAGRRGIRANLVRSDGTIGALTKINEDITALKNSLTPLYKKTITGTTTSTGALQLIGLDALTTDFIIHTRLASEIGYAFWRGDNYLLICNTMFTPAVNKEVTVEVVYCKRSELHNI